MDMRKNSMHLDQDLKLNIENAMKRFQKLSEVMSSPVYQMKKKPNI